VQQVPNGQVVFEPSLIDEAPFVFPIHRGKPFIKTEGIIELGRDDVPSGFVDVTVLPLNPHWGQPLRKITVLIKLGWDHKSPIFVNIAPMFVADFLNTSQPFAKIGPKTK